MKEEEDERLGNFRSERDFYVGWKRFFSQFV